MGFFSKFEHRVEDSFDGMNDKLFDAPISPVQIAKKAEKQMRREYEKRQSVGTVLSLDSVSSGDGVDEAGWLQDTQQKIDAEILWEEAKNDFRKEIATQNLVKPYVIYAYNL